MKIHVSLLVFDFIEMRVCDHRNWKDWTNKRFVITITYKCTTTLPKNSLFVFKLKLSIQFVKKSTRMIARSSRKPLGLFYIKWVIRKPPNIDKVVS